MGLATTLRPAFERTKVLIADDDPSSRLALTRALDRRGYDVIAAGGGHEAIDILEGETAPQLVVLDWMMPGVDGPEICRRIRSRDATRAGYTYVLMLTSRTDHDDVVEGLTAGADDYVTKPFVPSVLEARLKVGRRILDLEGRLRAERAEYQRRAQHDGLTGLWNRRTLIEGLERELSRGEREGRCVAVVSFDLDHFKRINDTQGHPIGDEVLIEAARRLRKELRPYDLLGRVGGEEFLAVLACRNQGEAVGLAERLRLAIAAQPFNTGAGALPVTTSVGLATSEQHGYAPTPLLLAVDRALYRAKHAGRNRVAVSGGELD